MSQGRIQAAVLRQLPATSEGLRQLALKEAGRAGQQSGAQKGTRYKCLGIGARIAIVDLVCAPPLQCPTSFNSDWSHAN
jgi:hypothetical protein